LLALPILMAILRLFRKEFVTILPGTYRTL
jgi:hypothetical protein